MYSDFVLWSIVLLKLDFATCLITTIVLYDMLTFQEQVRRYDEREAKIEESNKDKERKEKKIISKKGMPHGWVLPNLRIYSEDKNSSSSLALLILPAILTLKLIFLFYQSAVVLYVHETR